jgi:hypothetical protein
MLLHNELINDYNKWLRLDNYVGMTDISGCFDQILPLHQGAKIRETYIIR